MTSRFSYSSTVVVVVVELPQPLNYCMQYILCNPCRARVGGAARLGADLFYVLVLNMFAISLVVYDRYNCMFEPWRCSSILRAYWQVNHAAVCIESYVIDNMPQVYTYGDLLYCCTRAHATVV